MAKEIKAIQCPKCGSTSKIEIKPDFFKCTNCDTTYFLDNDDITINHNVNYTTGRGNLQEGKEAKKTLSRVLLAFAVLFLVGVIVLTMVTHSNRTVPNVEEAATYRWLSKDVVAFIGKDQKPILAILGQRMAYKTGGTEDGRYVGFYDLLSGKELKIEPVKNIAKADIERVYFKTFVNGDIYAIVNKTSVFKLDKGSLTLEDVTRKLFQSQPRLASGIANAEFTYAVNGDGIDVITNDGVSLIYYPIANKVYSKEELYVAQQALNKMETNEKTRTYFQFTSASSDYPQAKKQLIKFVQKDNAGGPNDLPYLELRKEKDDQGNEKPSLFRWGQKAVRSYVDLTPDKLYFDPKVLYSDASVVLVQHGTTAAEEAPTLLQCLDANTGKLIFSLPFTEKRYFDDTIAYPGGYVIKSNISVLVVDKKGKLVTEFKTI